VKLYRREPKMGIDTKTAKTKKVMARLMLMALIIAKKLSKPSAKNILKMKGRLVSIRWTRKWFKKWMNKRKNKNPRYNVFRYLFLIHINRVNKKSISAHACKTA
jgi:hypothetical protein